MSPGLIITVFSRGSRDHLTLFMQAHNDDKVDIRHCCKKGFGRFCDAWDGRNKKKRSN